MTQEAPGAAKTVFAVAATTILRNRWAKYLAVAFALFEIYNVGVVPAVLSTLEVRKLFAQLEVARQEAANAEERQKSEAVAISENAKVKLAEAEAAAVREAAEADKAEAEAITAEQIAKPSPERQKAEADKARNEGKIQLARAASARDQAKADADIAEQGAQKMKAEAFYAQQSLNDQIFKSDNERRNFEEKLRVFIGSPLPDLTTP